MNERAAIIVLYNPNIEIVLENLKRLRVQNCRTYLIDNSDRNSSNNINDYLSADEIYYSFGENKGIAEALNVGCNLAYKDGYSWVLTMDQDSEIPLNIFYEYFNYINTYHKSDIGILTPLINFYAGDNKSGNKSVDQIYQCYTSGGLTNLNVFKAVGGFRTDFFIDCVDFEYCFKLRAYGYKIFRVNTVVMNHQLGACREIKIYGKHLFYVTNHNYVRKYYMIRNWRYVEDSYKQLFPNEFRSHLLIYKVILKILLFENDKIRKLKSIRKGIKDHQKNITGKFTSL
jgi:rhamnosyltransferase